MEQPVSDDVIERVISDAMAGASSFGNLCNVSAILTTDPEEKRALSHLHDQEVVNGAPAALTFCADVFRTRRWLSMHAAKDNFDNLLGYHAAVCDTLILAQNVCLGFEAEGLGICYLGTTLQRMSEIAEFLDLPVTCAPLLTIVFGYPDEAPEPRSRLPLAAVLHRGKYRVHAEQELRQLCAQRDSESWAHYASAAAQLEKRNIRSLAQLYTSGFKYDPEVFRTESRRIATFLQDAGFLASTVFSAPV